MTNHGHPSCRYLGGGLVAAFRCLLVTTLVLLSPTARSQLTTILDNLNGGTPAIIFGYGGTTAVGYARDAANGNVFRAVRWTQGGLENLGTLNGGSLSFANGISGDGGTIVGVSRDGAVANATRAFRWTAASGMVSLGTLNGGNHSAANAASYDGNVIVGDATDGVVNDGRAFRWTSTTGMSSLGALNGGSYSSAAAVSADGSVVVGSALDGANGNRYRAYRWKQDMGMVSLGVVSGGDNSYGKGVSGDGKVVVGFWHDVATDSNRAFRWTAAEGMVSLGVAPGWKASVAYATNADGKVIVGRGDLLNGDFRAMRWTAASGQQTVEAWLQENGVAVSGPASSIACAVSGDGNTVAGIGFGGSFIARVTPASRGLIRESDLHESLQGRARAGNAHHRSVGLLLNGAHSAPLARRVATGRSAFWVAGDLGRDDTATNSSKLGIAEIGIGRNFGAAQLNAAIGHTRTRSDRESDQGTATRADGTFMVGELLIPLRVTSTGSGLWVVIDGYSHRGDSTISRSYLNTGLMDSSSGLASTHTTAFRARIEWDDMLRLDSLSFSPFGQYSVARARMDGYSETGGGFPLRYDTQLEKTTELHAGINVSLPVSNGSARVLAIVDAAHRFEGSAAATTGELPGLFNFTIPGQSVTRDWLRLGVGAEVGLGGGQASLMLNATSTSDAPNWWIAASWRTEF